MLADALPYLGVDSESHVLWLKDGSGTISFRLIPKFCLVSTESDLVDLRSALMNALSGLPEGLIAQFWMKRRAKGNESRAVQNWKGCHQSNEGSSAGKERLFVAKEELIQKLGREGLFFETEVIVTLRLTPDFKVKVGSQLGGLSQFAFWRKKTGKSEKTSSFLAQELSAAASGFRGALASAGFDVQDLKDEERVALIFDHLNPTRRTQASPKPDDDLSERVALTDLIEARDGLSLGKTKVRIGSVKSLPESTVPALAHLLSGIALPFDFLCTLMVLPQIPERERLSRKQRLAQGMASGDRVRNLFAEAQLQEVEETLSAMIGRGERLLASSFHLITQESGEEKRGSLDILLDQAARLGPGCQWFEETVGAHPVFFGNLPLAPTYLTRPKRILAPALTDLLPLYGSGPGHDEATTLFETTDQGIVGFSLFEKSPTGNAILIGSTGSGKSVLACGLILGMNAGNPKSAPSSFVIDVGNSFKRSLLYLGGSSLDLSPENGTRINPFDLPTGETFPDPEKVKFLTAFFDEVLGDNGSLSKLERAMVEAEIFAFYRSSEQRTLSGFKAHLEKTGHPDLMRLAKLLLLWVQPQPYGLLFDGETNVSLSTPHLHFELKGCQRYPDLLRVAMLVVMDLIWREIRKRFPKRSLVVMDEAHTLIRPSGDGRANGAARWVDDCFRQMRKFSSAAIAISQTAKDLKSAEIDDGILANAPNRFILRQRGDEDTLRKDLKLNDRELAEVFQLSQLRGEYSEFYLHTETMKGTLRYRPTPLELWLSTTHPPDLAVLQETQKKNPTWNLSELMDHLASEYPAGAERRSA